MHRNIISYVGDAVSLCIPGYEHVEDCIYQEEPHRPDKGDTIRCRGGHINVVPLQANLCLLKPGDNLECQAHASVGEETRSKLLTAKRSAPYFS